MASALAIAMALRHKIALHENEGGKGRKKPNEIKMEIYKGQIFYTFFIVTKGLFSTSKIENLSLVHLVGFGETSSAFYIVSVSKVDEILCLCLSGIFSVYNFVHWEWIDIQQNIKNC
jgi:hypothetical protein